MRQGCSCVLRTILLHRTTWVVPRNPVSVHRCQLPKKFAATLTFFWLVGIAWKNSGLPLYTFAATTSTIIGSRPQTRVKNNKNRIRWAAGSCRGGGIRKKKNRPVSSDEANDIPLRFMRRPCLASRCLCKVYKGSSCTRLRHVES